MWGVIVMFPAACPISGEMVDETASRISALLVTTILSISLFTPAHWLATVVLVDYSIKLIVGFRSSPLCALSRWIAHALVLPRRMTDLAPKRFAATLGFSFVTLALAGLALGLPAAFYTMAGIFCLCSLLDGAFGLCLGCRMYSLIPHEVDLRD